MSEATITTSQKIVVKNQWRDVFDGTVPADWEPSLSVSVVIASYNSATLPLTLASLAAQDYPEDLLDVVVVDDGSETPVTLGEYVPKNLQLIRVPDGAGWGRSNATDIGIKATKGDIIYWVDADMVLFKDNVRQHAKYAHFIPEAATIGHKGFVEEWNFTPQQVFEDVASGKIADFYDPETLHEHWSIQIYRDTDNLNFSAGRNYATHMGACATVTREVYDQTFGQDTRLHLGEDTEIAYQIWQAGGVFIPVNDARTWHLGRAAIQDHAERVAWHNDVHFAQRMPIPRYRRSAKNRIWEVPLVRAVVELDQDTAQYARNCVDRILASTQSDVQVDLVGPWSQLHEGRRRVLADPMNELYLVHEWFRSDSRVRFVETVPDSVYPTPYRLDVPVTVGLSADSLHEIYRYIDQKRLGIVRYFTPGHDTDQSVTVWDSAAIQRARKYVTADRDLADVIDEIWGMEWANGESIRLIDLHEVDLDESISQDGQQVTRLKAEVEQLKSENGELKRKVAWLREKWKKAEAAMPVGRRVAATARDIVNRGRRAVGRQ